MLQEAEICRNNAMQRALPYLEQALPSITDVYELSIVTYALHLAGSSERTKAFYDLADQQRTSKPTFIFISTHILHIYILSIIHVTYYVILHACYICVYIIE